jgi:CubicO group peptidase (beta-lactamase class C family)
MNDTGFYIDDAKKNRLVTVYEEIGKEKGITPKPRSQWTDYPISGERKYFSGGAGLTSTALDYAKLCQMLLNGGTFNKTRLLSRKTVELMTTNQIGELNIRDNTNKFGLGFEIYTKKEKHLCLVRKEPSNGAVCITHIIPSTQKRIYYW